MITPRAGSVDRDGDVRIGWVFQNPHGVAQRTALDHVVLPFLARGSTRGDAEAKAGEPDLLLIDEPTAQLDRSTAREVNRVISLLAETGTAIVVATHDQQTREACSEILDLGEQGPVGDA